MANSINFGSDYDLDEHRMYKDNDNHIGTGKYASTNKVACTDVNHPSHYNHGNIECIDAMESAFGRTAVEDFCIINAFKYLWRSRDKGGIKDINKAIWYLNKYKELMTKIEK